jgi:hypothetical protein
MKFRIKSSTALLISLLLFPALSCFSQQAIPVCDWTSSTSKLDTVLLPKMWVKKKESKDRIKWFLKNKYPKLKLISRSENTSIFFSDNGFRKLITVIKTLSSTNKDFSCLRTYFASFKNSLTLIFRPEDSNHNMIGTDYFTYTENGLEKINIIDNPWINNYLLSELNALNSTIDNNDPENKEGETKSITYPISSIEELECEMNYQRLHNNINVSGIKVCFASYTNKGNEAGKLKKRLHLVFELTRSVHKNRNKIFYIDDQNDFDNRLLATRKSINDKEFKIYDSKNEFLGFDNGQLCPPSANCPTP